MADHSMNHIENQRMDEYETRSETVSPLAVVCCFLFLILILLGIALVAAGGVVYQQNDNYMEVRTKALSKAITMWETECQGKMESLGDVVFQVEQSNHKETISGQSGTAAHVITELDNSPSVQVTFKHANAKPKKDSISVSAYMKSDKDRSIATVKDIPLRRTIDVPAVCECKSVGHSTPCYCKGKQICGKDVTFVGDEQNCTNGKVCGRCQGEGHLKQICLISKICDGSLVQSEFSGCAAPFSGDALSQVYGVESRDVTVFLYDENTPSIAKFRVSGGVGMNGPSKEKEQSRLKGTILFGVGIPVVVLAFISLIIICACQKWWCFGTSQSKNALEFNDIDIPMHGLNTMPSQNELHSTNYVNINERCTY